jgi:hypothetical protein
MNSRRNVRAYLHEPVRIRGTDRWGNPFEIQGESLDFSRKGLGLSVDKDIVAPGSLVLVDLPKKLRSSAVVQWTRREGDVGPVRLGVRLVDPQATLRFRLAACCLLAVALLGQVSLAKGRTAARSNDNSRCTVSLSHMKNMIENKLGKFSLVSDSEKAFIHLQHQQMSCDKYSHDFEKSGFFGDEKKRSAVEAWHWHIYHSQDEAVRGSAVQGAEATLGGTR